MLRLCLLLLIACSSKPKATVPAPPSGAVEEPPPAKPVAKVDPVSEAPKPAAETIAADTPKTTVAGNTFIAPAGWSLVVRGQATILTAPEGDSHIAIIDVKAKDADNAVALAWAAYNPNNKWPLKVTTPSGDKDGWTQVHVYSYDTPPNEKRDLTAVARFANEMWTVVILDVSDAVADKRRTQFGIALGKLLPKGYQRESFAGKKANVLDKARIAELGKFIESGEKLIGVPGVSVGIIQNGKVVFAGGFGVRELGKPAKVDGDTKYIVASNTKALTTLMLAKLVDEKKLTWDTVVTSLLPQFKLGDADTTSKVLVKHLICACTGMPRQDMEMIFEFGKLTPDGALAVLGTMQPTTKFGELYQYSNPLAAAAGFMGGHVAFPKLELGKAYDEAMRTRVFDPLGMKATTFDFKRGQQGNTATPHGTDIDNKMMPAGRDLDKVVIPMRPAGGAWSSVRDMLKYVQMELAEGKLPNGKPYIAKDTLLARRAPQVVVTKDIAYGMGLMIDNRFGTTVVSHGGDVMGFHSDMMWLPEHGVGVVILTNGDGGQIIRSIFKRKLLEVLFDGKPEADNDLAAQAKSLVDGYAAERKLLTVPPAADEVQKLAPNYVNEALGEIKVTKTGGKVVFDFGEWKSDVATKKNADNTTSFVTISPGIMGLPFVVGTRDGKRSLIFRDAQHEYVFIEK